MDKDKKNKNTMFYLLGSCIAEIATIPIYTIMTNYQTSNKSIIQITKNIYQQKKIFGFYNSVGYSVLSRLLSSGIKYNLYQNLKQYRNTQNSDLLNNMINSAISGCIGGIIVHPIDVCVNYTQRCEKITLSKKLFSGLTTTIFRNLLLYSLLFSMFDFVKHKTNNVYISCLTTTFITTSIMTPIEYIRSNIMTGTIKYNQIKIKNLYRGYYLNLTKNSMHFLITMVILEKIEEFIKK